MTNKPTDAAEDPSRSTPGAEYVQKGYELKASGSFEESEANFRRAISLEPTSIEAHYGLGLVLKAQDRRQESIQIFEKVLGLLESETERSARAQMLRRLVKAHINQLREGNWDLEKEIWKHK